MCAVSNAVWVLVETESLGCEISTLSFAVLERSVRLWLLSPVPMDHVWAREDNNSVSELDFGVLMSFHFSVSREPPGKPDFVIWGI